MSLKKSQNQLSKRLGAQIEALNAIYKVLPAIDAAAKTLAKSKGRIIITGIGKSAFVGMKLAATYTSLGQRAIFIHPVDALHGDVGIIHKSDTLIALSASGETNEVLRLARFVKREYKLILIAITSNKNSSLAKIADQHLAIEVKDEGSPYGHAPMASATATLVVGDLLAAELATRKNLTEKDFARMHPAGDLGRKLRLVKEVMQKKNLPLVSASSNLKDVLQALSQSNKRGVVGVVKNGKLVGVITDGDVRRFLLKGETKTAIEAQDLMSKHPKTIGGDANLHLALRQMREEKITSLFVVKARKPIGLVRLQDIIEDIA
jgi:arabinose-5-phosphate isomerase